MSRELYPTLFVGPQLHLFECHKYAVDKNSVGQGPQWTPHLRPQAMSRLDLNFNFVYIPDLGSELYIPRSYVTIRPNF